MLRALIVPLVACLFLPPALAGEKAAGWPQFRGPDGQGHVAGKIPSSWGEGVNNPWRTPIPGKGWSSPVILERLVWMTTAVEAKGGYSLRAIGIDEDNGKIRHDIELFATTAPPKLHARNSHATPTPVLEPGRLYASFGPTGTACIDTGSGAVLWRNTEMRVDYATGPASSLVLYKDLLICCCDGADLQFIAGLDKTTGKIVWKTERDAARGRSSESRRAFSTPLVIDVAGRDQLVSPGADCVYSYEPATGKEIWRVRYSGFSNVPRPVYAHGLVYVSSGFAPPELLAIRPDGQGDVTKTHVAWRYRKNVPNVSSPVAAGDALYFVADSGTLTCLDPASGKARWTQRLNGTFSASPLAAGETVYAFDEDGKTVLFQAGKSYQELGRNDLTGRVQASPAVDAGYLFVRTDRHLYKLGR